MGQKVHPTGFRLVIRKKWLSKWYTEKDYSKWVGEDFKIRQFLQEKKKTKYQGVSKFEIERTGTMIKISIHTSKPGIIYGTKGAEIELLKKEIHQFISKIREIKMEDIELQVVDIKFPALDAQCVADSIAKQLERRLPFRRVMKKSMQDTMAAREAKGIKIQISGRIGGAEIARAEWYKEGRIPSQTLRANIDYAHGRAETTYGSIGVKVWINRGEDFVAKPKQQAIGV
jgi:small subunit ribosomal protein S3